MEFATLFRYVPAEESEPFNYLSIISLYRQAAYTGRICDGNSVITYTNMWWQVATRETSNLNFQERAKTQIKLALL